MTLPVELKRCFGRWYVTEEPDFAGLDPECQECARRSVDDYLHAKPVEWMTPPAGEPCPERLGMKR